MCISCHYKILFRSLKFTTIVLPLVGCFFVVFFVVVVWLKYSVMSFFHFSASVNYFKLVLCLIF